MCEFRCRPSYEEAAGSVIFLWREVEPLSSVLGWAPDGHLWLRIESEDLVVNVYLENNESSLQTCLQTEKWQMPRTFPVSSTAQACEFYL